MNDDLVKFAAGKLGVKLSHDADHKFYWLAECWETYNTGDDFTLSSPDLFLRGLGAIKKDKFGANIWINGHNRTIEVGYDTQSKAFVVRECFNDPNDLPEAFWTAWFKLEHQS